MDNRPDLKAFTSTNSYPDGKAGASPILYFYCFIQFQKNGKQYAYLSDDRTVEAGDCVVVKTDCETVVSVVRVQEYTEEQAPYPPSRCKRILRLFAKGKDLVEANRSYTAVPLNELSDNPESLRDDLFDFLKDEKYTIKPNPVCTESQVKSIENAGATRLPSEYRRFLLEVGNGIAFQSRSVFGNSDSGDYERIFGIPSKYTESMRLYALPFRFDEPFHSYISLNPYAKQKNEYDDCYYNHEETEDIDNACIACKHKRVCTDFFSDETDTYEYPFFNGTLMLHYAGCTYTYHLILNGKHRGEVWIANETYDFVPVAKSFSEFLRKRLENELL